jgi:hypothetical protein
MKVNLVKDATGKVIATFENARSGGPSIKPVLQAGLKVQEVDAPDNYRADIKGFYAKNSG